MLRLTLSLSLAPLCSGRDSKHQGFGESSIASNVVWAGKKISVVNYFTGKCSQKCGIYCNYWQSQWFLDLLLIQLAEFHWHEMIFGSLLSLQCKHVLHIVERNLSCVWQYCETVLLKNATNSFNVWKNPLLTYEVFSASSDESDVHISAVRAWNVMQHVKTRLNVHL